MVTREFGTENQRQLVFFQGRCEPWQEYHPASEELAAKMYTGYEEFLPAICAQNYRIAAVRDAFHLLMALGYPVRPVGDEKSLEPGPMNMMVGRERYLQT